MEQEIVKQFLEATKKEISLSSLCEKLNISIYEVFYIINRLKEKGIAIIANPKDDDIYIINKGDYSLKTNNEYNLFTDNNNKIKFVVISDLRMGSKYQQLSILNDIILKAKAIGITNILICGNISEGLYKATNKYATTLFQSDTLKQAQYIIDNYPMVEGMTTYFITGPKDEKHLKANVIDIGKRISSDRSDMIYLGMGRCLLNIDNARVLVQNLPLEKTYTMSYRTQQSINAFRSEDKPQLLLYGGLLQMERYNIRGVDCITIPSVVATTPEMSDKRHSNVIGAWYITIHTNEKGEYAGVSSIDSVYYRTDPQDYEKARTLRMKGAKPKNGSKRNR